MHLADYLNHLQRFGIAPGLERIRALLERAGNPQARYPIILVGGTNGKGSTCQFLAQQLAAEGRIVGLYTSPHLYNWNERIQVLRPGTASEGLFPYAIPDTELDALLEEALPHIAAVAAVHGQPTEFETLTLLGLWHFARAAVEIAVVEVGLGGRWDATNATEPTVSVITHVALDHCDRLGETVEEIARDKVEIARPDRILVTAETKPQVLHVFRGYCEEHSVRLWPWQAPEWSNDGAALNSIELPNSPALEFQQINLGTARTARAALAQILPAQFPLAPVAEILELAVPGRLEVLRENPRVLIDGANNPDGAALLAEFLRRELNDPQRHLILVLGILGDKDYAAMTAQLAPLASYVIATQSGSPRAVSAEAVAEIARRYCREVEVAVPVAAAVEKAMQRARPADVVCITGSFYTIAEVNRTYVRDRSL